MDHVAIMSPSRHLIKKILSGEKTIESRWYTHRITPWDKIQQGDTVYFKDAGKQVTAKATVKDVMQFTINSEEEGLALAKKFSKQLCFSNAAFIDTSWIHNKRYVILVELEHAQEVTPFTITKKGFGSACAWLTIPHIKTIIS